MKALLLALGLVLPAAAAAATPVIRPIIGVKIYDSRQGLDTLFAAWKGLGVNAVFASADLCRRKDFMDTARARRIPVYAIVPVFFNPEELAKNPDWFSVTGDGKPAKDTWVEFACPNNPDYRHLRLAYIRDLVKSARPDGLSIDFIRYFAFWEMIYPDARLDPLKSACFCHRCLKSMSEDKAIGLPDTLPSVEAKARWVMRHRKAAWARWKCGLIESMVEEIAAMARGEQPGIKLNLHVVPWRAKDFGGARRAVIGQDLKALARHVDYLSPMTYAPMVKRPAEWVHAVTAEIARAAPKPVLPSIQVSEAYLPAKVSVEEFTANLRSALRPPSRGVIFWSWERLAADSAKLAAARAVLGKENRRSVP